MLLRVEVFVANRDMAQASALPSEVVLRIGGEAICCSSAFSSRSLEGSSTTFNVEKAIFFPDVEVETDVSVLGAGAASGIVSLAPAELAAFFLFNFLSCVLLSGFSVVFFSQ